MIVDAGPLYAAVDRRDAHHDACVALLSRHAGPLLVPALVITEVTHLLSKWLGSEPEVRFLGDLASGSFATEPVHPSEWTRIAELVWRYRDLGLGTVDASLVAAAERLGIAEVATLDRRHLGVVRPKHVERFTLLP